MWCLRHDDPRARPRDALQRSSLRGVGARSRFAATSAALGRRASTLRCRTGGAHLTRPRCRPSAPRPSAPAPALSVGQPDGLRCRRRRICARMALRLSALVAQLRGTAPSPRSMPAQRSERGDPPPRQHAALGVGTPAAAGRAAAQHALRSRTLRRHAALQRRARRTSCRQLASTSRPPVAASNRGRRACL